MKRVVLFLITTLLVLNSCKNDPSDQNSKKSKDESEMTQDDYFNQYKNNKDEELDLVVEYEGKQYKSKKEARNDPDFYNPDEEDYYDDFEDKWTSLKDDAEDAHRDWLYRSNPKYYNKDRYDSPEEDPYHRDYVMFADTTGVSYMDIDGDGIVRNWEHDSNRVITKIKVREAQEDFSRQLREAFEGVDFLAVFQEMAMNPTFDSIVNEQLDVRAEFVDVHTEAGIDEALEAFQQKTTVKELEELGTSQEDIDMFLNEAKRQAVKRTDELKANLAEKKGLFKENNPELYNEEAEKVLYYDFGKEFVYLPLGDISFADKVVSYTIGDPAPPQAFHLNPENAITPPGEKDEKENGWGAVTLGVNGTLTLQFNDNVLVDINGPDLYVFETFNVMEPTLLEISNNGFDWINVGIIEGGQAEVDIHDHIQPGDAFYFVRLTDQGKDKSYPPGADIDAVATIGSAIKLSLDASVLFDFGEDNVKEGASVELAKLAEVIGEYKNARITVAGHTDDIGDDASNLQLSKRRAASVSAYLKGELKQAAYSWTEQGHGESRPVEDNATEEGRSANRRVEILIQPTF